MTLRRMVLEMDGAKGLVQERMTGEKLGTRGDHSLVVFCCKREERDGKVAGVF